jgi:hypothetical protein
MDNESSNRRLNDPTVQGVGDAAPARRAFSSPFSAKSPVVSAGQPAAPIASPFGGFGRGSRSDAARSMMQQSAAASASSQRAFNSAAEAEAAWKKLTEEEQKEWAKLPPLDRSKAETAYFEAKFPLHDYLKEQGWIATEGAINATDRSGYSTTTRFVRGPGEHPRYPGQRTRGAEEVNVTLKTSEQAGPGQGRDRWMWVRPDGKAGGGLINFMREVEGRDAGAETTGRQMAQIRAHMKLVVLKQPYNVAASNGVLAASTAIGERLRADGGTGETVRLGDHVGLVRDGGHSSFPSIADRWAQCRPGINAYLRDVRGIKEDVLFAFRAGIRNEPVGQPNRLMGFCGKMVGPDGKDIIHPSTGREVWVQENEKGFCAAHVSEDGRVVGFERKGPRPEAAAKGGSFSKFAKTDKTRGERKLLTRLTDVPKDAAIHRIYAGESVVDLLSIFQHDGQKRGVILCSAFGQTTPEAFDAIGKLAAKHPGAQIHLSFDGDVAGQKFAAKAMESLSRLSPESQVVMRVPPVAFKDWNDVLLGKTRADVTPQDALAARMSVTAEAIVNERDGIIHRSSEIYTGAHDGSLSVDECDTATKAVERRTADLARLEATFQVEHGHAVDPSGSLVPVARPSRGLDFREAIRPHPASNSFFRSMKDAQVASEGQRPKPHTQAI